MSGIALTGRRFTGHELPATDALEFVRAGIKQMPRRYDVRVTIHAPLAEVSSLVGRWAELSEVPDGTLMVMPTDDLFWPLAVLASLDATFEVQAPAELRDQVAAVARRFAGAAAG
jgi:predicted DNA-binding transcriptional regulator YafY